ncbi:MAG: DUF2169 domain-containing protein [Byssovorax sp.]
MSSDGLPDPDPEVLAYLSRPEHADKMREVMVRAASSDMPVTVDWTKGEREGKRVAGVVLKRTYRLHKGRFELSSEGQEALIRGELGYFDDSKSVRLAPPIFVNDYYAARRKTDVVIQGFAFAPSPATRHLTATVRFGKHERSIEVYGARRGEYDAGKKPRFSEPEPFEMIPIRYDLAYGGVDMVALARKLGYPDPDAEVAIPEETEFHYPRNPCGLGYLMELDWESFMGLRLPHLEHPFDPLTPERLAVGAPGRWLRGSLPAAWDWQSESWFPRAAYLGMAPLFDDDGTVPAEVQKGWAARDILEIPMIFHDLDGTPRREYSQAASPGMSFTDLSPREHFEIKNMHPKEARLAFDLPGDVPKVTVAFQRDTFTELESRLCSVVIRPDREELVATWSALAEVDRDYEKLELMSMRSEIAWARGREAT